MNKKLYFLITGVITAGILSGCGGGSSNSSYKASAPSMAAEEAYMSDDMYESYDYAIEEPEEAPAENGVEKVGDETVANTNRKIIRNVNLDAETEEFDSFIANVNAKVIALGGYMESTNISGRSINASKSSMRNASLTARIPAQNLDQFITNISDNSNILNKSESANDVTLSYADTQAHIKSLRTEQERLDELLLQADDIETIIAIEQRITDVRYELESYESRLRTMDNQVDYSTVYINVREVERYTPVEEPKQTIGERIVVGFTENLIDAKDFVVDFFVGFIVAIPILVVLILFIAIPVVIIWLIVRYIIGRVKGQEYREQIKAKKIEKKAKKNSKSVAKATAAPTQSTEDKQSVVKKEGADNKEIEENNQ